MISATTIPDFVERKLCRIAETEGFHHFQIDIVDKVSEATHVSSQITRLIIRGNKSSHDQVELRLLYKILSANSDLVDLFGVRESFEREIYVYKNVFPRIFQFVQAHNLAIDDYCPVPKFYDAIHDRDNDEYLIILEDLTQSSIKIYDKYCYFDVDHCKVLLDQLAKFHAISFAMGDQVPDIMDEMKLKLSDIYVTQRKTNKALYDFTKASMESASDTLNPSTDKIELDKFTKLRDHFIDELERCVDLQAADPFGVISHGDVWCNNFLYVYKDDQPTSVFLLDWQLCRFGSPALDLAQFLFISTTREFRDQYQNELIEYYHNSLISAIDRMGSNGKLLFPFDMLQQQFRHFGLFALILAPVFLLFFTGIKCTRGEMLKAMLNYRTRSVVFANPSSSYIKVMSDLIKDCVKYKCL